MLPFLNGHYRGCSVGDLVSDDVQAIILHQKKKIFSLSRITSTPTPLGALHLLSGWASLHPGEELLRGAEWTLGGLVLTICAGLT